MNLLIHDKKSLVLMPILCYESRAERDFADLIPALATAVRSDDMKADLPSPETLRKLLRYEPETGKLFWRERGVEYFDCNRMRNTWNSRYANKEAFTTFTPLGYRQGRLFNRTYFAHRLIWVMQTGEWPKETIDHIDRDKSNNRIENLREATMSQNSANIYSKPNSTSKFLGVCWASGHKKWMVQIKKNKVKRSLGLFSCEIEAAKAYDREASKLHGKFANLNFPNETTKELENV